ncbi:cell division protein ZapA [Legionella sp. W05-934-2]|jgi:cell division protein ZapA|uniref:cell division protein ZapA n=1 Tax=Legionella sp. W05-934-2 TaxID=1198649 RepID=UPI0034619710
MAKSQQCQIRLLSKLYDIKCPNDKVDKLNLAARKLDTLMVKYKQQYPLLDDNKLLLLSALEVAYQLIERREPASISQKDEVNALIHTLENRINAVVGKEEA